MCTLEKEDEVRFRFFQVSFLRNQACVQVPPTRSSLSPVPLHRGTLW